MKTLTMVVVLILLFAFCSNSGTKEISQKEKVEKSDLTKKEKKQVIKKMLKEAFALWDSNKLNKSLTKMNEAIKYSKGVPSITEKILKQKYSLLHFGLKEYDKALKIAKERDKILLNRLNKKDPWSSIAIASVYLNLNKQEEALNWMEETVNERKFAQLGPIQKGLFTSVKDNKRARILYNKIENIIGIGKPAKDFKVVLYDKSKSEFVLSKNIGKVVLIDFWSTTCPPCLKEMPELKKIYSKFKDKGLEIIGLSVDQKESIAKEYSDKHKLEWKMACLPKNWSDDIFKLYKVLSVPATFLIDRKGVLRYCDLRGHEMKIAIEKLINE